jgi:rhodanese-related sulfurtransferase
MAVNEVQYNKEDAITGHTDLALSIEAVQQILHKKPETILIDVREKEDYEKFRIPGSINMPIFAIKTKTYLKAAPIIFVNEGNKNNEMIDACSYLRQMGFRIWYLKGGLNAWKGRDASFTGNSYPYQELNEIFAKDFFAERNSDNWMIIDISTSEHPKTHLFFPGSISIPVNDEKKIVSSIKINLARYSMNSPPLILIFNNKGEGYQRIAKAIEKTGIQNVFYLRGGIEAYIRFIEEQTIIKRSKSKPAKTINPCAPCS